MTEMTSLERVQAVLEGRVPDRLPVIPQGFMFSAKTAGYDIGAINRSPAKMAESHLHCQEKYGYDGCVIDVDDATLAEACGARVIFREQDVASVDEHAPILEDLRAIDDLKMPDPLKDGRICEWLETTERIVSAVGGHVFVMGRADQGPFSLLCLLRGTQEFMVDLLTEDEDVILHALEWTTEAHTRFAKAQLLAGAHATSMGDAYASPNLISPEMYRKFAFPYEKQVAENLKDTGKPYSIHICGDTNGIVPDMGRTGAKILEVDWKVDMGRARQALPGDVVLMGNLDPSDPMCLGTPDDVRAKARDLIQKTRGQGLILSSGCALGANTKPENMAALVECAKLYGTREQLLQLRGKPDMIHTLKNDLLTVDINDKGAQLWSIRTADGTEYLWQGDPKYWDERALNLFPQIGLCTNGVYTLKGKTYPMDAHGFVKDTVLTVSKPAENTLVFSCGDTAETWEIYPFHFRYAIAYTLVGGTIQMKISVENQGGEELYFSVGGHPGFNIPLEEGLAYDDYRLQFPAGSTAKRAECTAGDCLMLDRITEYPLVDSAIPLSHELFAQRVLILTDMPHQVTLQARGGSKSVTVSYPDMKYLGIWKWLGTDAPYVCIEPWTGVSARENIVEDYERHPDMIHLAPAKRYENNWSIEIK